MAKKQGVYEDKLSYFTPDEQLVPTPEELAKPAMQCVEQEKQKNERLAAKLRELGVDPDAL